jgi:four helix bundle protein
MSKYQNLDAWKITMLLVTDIYNLTKTYALQEAYSLTSQTRRAAISIPSNIAEGMGRQYKKDKSQFLHISRGSLYELEILLHIANRVAIIIEEELNRIILQVEKSLQIFNGLINYIQKSKLK